jgi:hypothetical protein
VIVAVYQWEPLRLIKEVGEGLEEGVQEGMRSSEVVSCTHLSTV